MISITTPNIRAAERVGARMILAGQAGIGKTYLARTLRDHTSAVFINLERGTLSIRDTRQIDGVLYPPFGGLMINGIETWDELVEIMLIVTGPVPGAPPTNPFSAGKYEEAKKKYSAIIADGVSIYQALKSCRTLFIDSLTKMSHLAEAWARTRPDAFTAKGAFDSFAMYRLLGTAMINVMFQLQKREDLNIIYTCILDIKPDGSSELQLVGQYTAKELVGIVDQIISYVELSPIQLTPGEFAYILSMRAPTGVPRYRSLVTKQNNPWGLVAKDRGDLLPIEAPDLGAILGKISGHQS